MPLEKLHIKNLKHFPQVNIRFNSGFNFITGPNGCGKTSVLAAIAHCLFWNGVYSRHKEDSEYWIDFDEYDKKYRFGLGPGFLKAVEYRKDELKIFTHPPSELGIVSAHAHQVSEILKLPPLIIGAQRKISYKSLSGVIKEKNPRESRENYCKTAVSSLYNEHSREVKQWIVNRYFMVDKPWAREEKENWDHLINSLPKIGPFNSEFAYVATGRNLEPVFKIYDKECYLEELSSGFQAVLYIIISIFEWVESCLPEGERIVSKASGTVLIDELDNHLHPEWQLTIRQGIETLFPNMQFIVTTHSPHLLAAAKENEIILLPSSYSESVYNISPSEKAYSGWSTDLILTDLMGVKSLDNKNYEQLVHACFNSVTENDLQGMKVNYALLEAVSHPDDTVLMVLKTRMAGMEAVSND